MPIPELRPEPSLQVTMPGHLPLAAERHRGSMLIVALAVLTLLSLIASTFVALMRLEHKATANFKDRSQVELLTTSAESAVVALLRSAPFWDGHVHNNRIRSPWLYGLNSPNGRLSLGGTMPLETADPGDTSLGGKLTFGSYRGGGNNSGEDRYRVKLIDTTAQIYLNARQDTLGDLIDNLGEALDGDDEFKINPFYSGRNETGIRIRGRDVIRFRNRLPGGEFKSKSQLKALIGKENFNIVSDFITAHAWVNPYTFRSTDGREVNSNHDEGAGGGLDDLGNPSLVGGVNRRQANPPVEGIARLSPEPRAPININTAPEPVLVATLIGLGGRRPFPFVDIRNEPLEQGNLGSFDLGGGTLAPVKEELAMVQTPVWVYTRPLEEAQARRIAQAIIARRKQQPFKTWSSGQGDEAPGFEEFINSLDDSYFPGEASVVVINPRLNNGRNMYSSLQAPGSRELWQQGFPSAENGIRRSLGLPSGGGSHAWYRETIRSVLTANFNPNTRINKGNPNNTVWRPIDKANLVKLDLNNYGDVRLGHTTDYCFDTKGIFEITTFAEILGPGRDDEDDEEKKRERVFAETMRRSVVKVFDVFHHTHQVHFEQPFAARGLTSAARSGNREYVSTWPDPIDALEPDFYPGSVSDGRVELSGAIDAQQQVASETARISRWSGNATLRLAHDFRFRSEESRRNLARLLRTGANADGAVREFGKIFDPTYSQKGGSFRRRYSSHNWNAGDSNVEVEQLKDPLVNEAQRGSDLMPDGLNSSMFRSSALGARFLRFPAGRYRANPLDQGEMNRNYNNDVGNLPYYNGSVSFWVKLEFNGDDPTFSGLIGATQVQTKVGQNPSDSEGNQFWVWKNTEGQLRVSRLYYHQAFLKGYTSQAVPLIGDEEELSEEDFESDSQKLWARTDVVVDVSRWRAHEWHHLAISFDDQSSTNRIRVWLDHEQVDAVNHNIGDGMFCALNEEEPKDQIQVGGFFRDQAVADEGLFKFGTNFTTQGIETAPSVKRVLANATIDEFRVYLGAYTQDDSRGGGYFTEQRGTYTNAFQIPLPDGIQRVRLRNMTWTVYPPKMYAQRPVLWNPRSDLTFSALGVDNSPQPRRLGDSGGSMEQNKTLAGRWLYGRGNNFGKVGELLYQVQMRGAQGTGADAGKIVGTPVLDDVTLSVYLPSTEYLLTETLD